MRRHALRRDQVPLIIASVTKRLQAIADDLVGAEGEIIVRIFISEHQPDVKVTLTKG